MSATKLEKFGGMLPAWSDRNLPPDQAALAQNCYLFSGELIGWRVPKLLHTLLNSAAGFAYRIPVQASGFAQANLIFNTNPNGGDTVTVGEITYRLTSFPTNPFDVLIGNSSAATAQNLLEALTATGVAGTTYGVGTFANSAVDQSNPPLDTVGGHDFGNNAGVLPWLFVQAPAVGASYNLTIVAESTAGTRMVWLSDLNSLADTTFTFTGGANLSEDDSITGNSLWLEFVDPDTDVVKTQVVDDVFQRYYFASPSQPPQYNTYDRIAAAQAPWLLGVPAPGIAPTVNPTGGGNLATIGSPTITGVPNPATFALGATASQWIYLLPVTPNGAMSVNDISFIAETNSAGSFVGVVYNDADEDGKPDLLISTDSSPTVGAIAGQSVVMTLDIPVPLNANETYWIGFITNDGGVQIQCANNNRSGQAATISGFPTAPGRPPTLTPAEPTFQLWADVTTSAILEARSYVYTWVTQYGEEGPPSPPTTDTAWSNSTWTIGFYPPALADTGTSRNINRIRLYRTVTGTSGSTVFFLVSDDVTPSVVSGGLPGDLPITQTSYADTISDAIVGVNAELQSSLWSPPPTDLQGIRAMPNGMYVGFRANEIWFSEPYRPHAWPASYVLTTEFPIVGIGIAGQSVVACTTSVPYTATGVNPASMALTRAKIAAPCLFRGSIVSTAQGVYYSSIKGLIFIDPSGAVENVTERWVTQERWTALTPSKNMRAIELASTYFCYGTVFNNDASVAQQGFHIELAPDSSSFSIWPQPGGHRLGMGELTAPLSHNVVNLFVDPWSGFGMMIQNGGVYYYDFTDQAPVGQPYIWRSKIFQDTSKKNYEAAKVFFTVPPGTPAQNPVRDVNEPQPVFPDTPGQYGILRVYADISGIMTVVQTREIRNSGELLRIVSGFKSEFWQFEINAIVRVANLQVATSVRELGNV